MPAEHRNGTGVFERRARQRLELGLEHCTLLLVELELVEPFGDREPVEAGEPVER